MLKLIPLIFLMTLVSFQRVYAGWVKTYSRNDRGANGMWCESTTDGGFIIVGSDNEKTTLKASSDPALITRLYLVKTDSLGDTLWTKLYGDTPYSLFSWGRCIQETQDGGYIAAGNAVGYAWLVKFDEEGDTAWSNVYNKGDYQASEAYCVRETNNGYISAGNLQLWNTNALLLLCYDSLGDTLWSRSYYKEDNNQGGGMGFSLQVASDGGFIVTGSGPDKGLWILRTDSLGDTLWTKLYKLGDPLTYDEGHSIEPTSDGGWIITGAVDYSPAEYGAIALMKIDSLGDTLWTKYYDYSAADEDGKSVKQTPDGGFIVVATKGYSMLGKGAIWLLKTDSAGDTLWTRTYGGNPQDCGNCLQLTPDGGFIITGYTSTWSTDTVDRSKQVLLMKLDSLGLLGVTEGPLVYALSKWELSNPLGKEVTLRYSDFPHGFHACIYDASGRKVDELSTPNQSGVLVWGPSQNPGVYFVVAEGSNLKPTKVVLVR